MTMFRLNGVPANVRALPILQSASGSVATFDTDMTENLIEVVCDIQYSQASGTPSPSNPLPITTFSEMNVIQMSDITNKSYFDGLVNGTYNYFVDLSTLNWGVYGTNRFYVGLNPRGLNSNLTSLCSAYQREPNNLDNASMIDKSYSIKGTYMVICDSSFSSVDDFKNSLSGKSLIYELNTPITPTITESDFNTLLTAFGIGGEMHNIPFGQTVAKGTLNVTTGKLEITHEILTLDGTESVSVTGTATNRRFRFNNILTYNALTLSSHFIEIDSNTSPWGYYRFVSGYLMLLDVNSQMADETALKTWLANQYSGGTPVQFLCELASPTTIQLDSNQVQALLNENNIWCDTGDTEVKYWMSINKYIGQ